MPQVSRYTRRTNSASVHSGDGSSRRSRSFFSTSSSIKFADLALAKAASVTVFGYGEVTVSVATRVPNRTATPASPGPATVI